jgi:hypothetical protein
MRRGPAAFCRATEPRCRGSFSQEALGRPRRPASGARLERTLGNHTVAKLLGMSRNGLAIMTEWRCVLKREPPRGESRVDSRR